MGLSLGYYLQRAGAHFIILDAEDGPGGAWRHGWDSLRLFSPAGYSSLPGWLMPPPNHDGYPTRGDVVDYLARYEDRYQLPVRRPVRVTKVYRGENCLEVIANEERLAGKVVVCATGTWSRPHIPEIPGRQLFQGVQLHSANYASPDDYVGQTILVVGGGNSGAQIMAEIASVARALWVTTQDPRFLPDDVDGRVLFERAVARMMAGAGDTPVGGIGDIVMVPPVKAARDRGDLVSVRPFMRMTPTGVVWPDGSATAIDGVIWCTGFQPALDFLRPLDVVETNGQVLVERQRSVREPRLLLAGYGDWTGPGSATLMGAARTARDIASQLVIMVSDAAE
ncbi:MAG: NAD(P)/FAD-dependent oxidoreductase [Sphingopyxis sp.]|nr:NAD(P)/FAD-dependent oxidoreductase [Sphingopyxis sp.]